MKRLNSIVLAICLIFLLSATSCGANSAASWICPECENHESGEVCSICGAKKPETESSKNTTVPSIMSNLIGGWHGQVDNQLEENKKYEAYLYINKDGTWAAVRDVNNDGEIFHGYWNPTAENRNILELTVVENGKEIASAGTFGKVGNSYNWDFDDWYHYTIGMDRGETGTISQDDLIGKWSGQVKKEYSDKMIDISLSINSDKTWVASLHGDTASGYWRNYSDSGKIIALTIINSDGSKNDSLWYFGKLNGNYICGFNDWYSYDAIMEKDSGTAGSNNSTGLPSGEVNFFGEWHGRVGNERDVYLFINEDGTLASVHDGNLYQGKWSTTAENSNILTLTVTKNGKEIDSEGTFGKYGNSYNWRPRSDQAVEMRRVEAGTISTDDLKGKWAAEDNSKSNKTIDVNLIIFSNETWEGTVNGREVSGRWKSCSNNGEILALTIENGDGSKNDSLGYFGKLDGTYKCGFNDWYSYDAIMHRNY